MQNNLQKVRRLIEKPEPKKCPRCNSENWVKSGKAQNEEWGQRYLCKNCKKIFYKNRNPKSRNRTKPKPRSPLPDGLKCFKCGSYDLIKAKKGGKRKQSYSCKTCGRNFVENPVHRLRNHSNLDLSDDVWSASSLGIHANAHEYETKLIFISIKQLWLKDAAKKFIRYRAATKKFGTVRKNLCTINQFSDFLSECYPEINMNNLNRSVILDYINWLNESGRTKYNTKMDLLGTLRTFFEVSIREKWLDIPWDLIRQDDYPKKTKAIPRYIPDEVIVQLNQHLDKLPLPVMRMVLVIQESGMRLSELCQLSLDCLRQDAQGDYFLQFMRWKMTKEDSIPISKELAVVIKEQQQYIQDNFGNEHKYLFCALQSIKNGDKQEFIPALKVMKGHDFADYLKELAEKYDIKDSLGNLWNFQTHQFRHTVGTRMINNGVPQHIVQRYLGHESPKMTAVYAHIFDETLKKEIAIFHNKIVNIAGQVVAADSVASEIGKDLDPNSIDAQWLKRNILAQALPNGLCTRPVVQGACPYGANKCLNCESFRTDSRYLDKHKEHLKRTTQLVEWTQENLESRRAVEILKENLPIKENLERIISSLEVSNVEDR